MASIKLHVYRTEMGDNGTESCDYRGKGEHGAGVDDQHRTVIERDPASESEINGVLMKGPAANQAIKLLTDGQPDLLADLASMLGLDGSGPVGLRLGVWDQ